MNNLIFMFLAITLLACSQNPEYDNDSTEQNKQSNLQSAEQPKEIIERYKSGVVKINGKEVNGKRTGKWESFYENGYRWSETNYKNGFRDGPIVVYYTNGMMRYDGNYYSDERSGIWQFYDTTGILVKRINMDLAETVPDSLFR